MTLLREFTGICKGDAALREELRQLCTSYCERTGAAQQASTSGRGFDRDTPEQKVLRYAWGRGHRARGKLHAGTLFDGHGLWQGISQEEDSKY